MNNSEEKNKNIEKDTNDKKRRIYKMLLIALLSIAFFEILFLFFAKPIFENIIQNKVYKGSDSVYTVEFNELKINLFTGNILLTDFKLIPDTTAYFAKNKEMSENLYEIQLDSFQIGQIRIFPLLKKENELSIKLLGLTNPNFKVFAQTKKDTIIQIEENSASYENVRQDVISKIFQYVTVFKVEQIKIINGNFDFLKPRSDNTNPFSIGKITFILNDFLVDKNTFSQEKKHIFSENIEVIIADYELELNDNIHKLSAKEVYINTKTKIIKLGKILLNTTDISVEELEQQKINIFDIKIDSIIFVDADFKEIYENSKFHLTKAEMNGLNINIYKQKIKEKKKFNKDTLLGKIDIYPLFRNFLEYIHIDTLLVNSGNYNDYSIITDNQPKTSIAKFNIRILDFLIDSISATDTCRLLYAKEMTMNIDGFQTKLKDSIHSLTIKNIVASTQQKGITANSIKMKPSFRTQAWAILNHKNFNNISIETFSISGFNFNKFSNDNELYIDKFELGKTDLSLKSFPDTLKKEKKTQSLDQLFGNFADKIFINEINIPTGNLNIQTLKKNGTTSISTNFRIIVNGFSFDPFKENIAKTVAVQGVNFLLDNFKFVTPDKIYQFSIDTLKYSTYESNFWIANLRLKPSEDSIYTKLRKYNKSSIAKIFIPKLVIKNTNLSNAFQSDSLNLKIVSLNNPEFEITTFPDISQKVIKNDIINSIKRETINQIVRTSADIEVLAYSNTNDIDSATYEVLAYKKYAIDTITKLSTNIITLLKIKPKDIRVSDSSINVIRKIEKISINGFNQIANSNLTIDQIDTIIYSALSQIDYLGTNYNRPKFNKDEIYSVIGQYLPKINSDSLYINNGKIVLKSRTAQEQKIIFKTNFDLYLYYFSFNIDSVKNNKKVFFSNAFMFGINNMVVNFKDNLHQLIIDKIQFRSKESSIYMKNLSYTPLHKDTSKINIFANITEIYASNVDFKKLFFDKTLNIDKILIDRPNISVNLIKKKNKNKNKITYIFLPSIVEQISINLISTINGNISLKKGLNDTTIEFLSTNFDIKLHNFFIDSVTNIPKNTFFLPIKNMDFELNNFTFLTKDTLQKISIQNLIFSTSDEIIDIKNLFFKSTITDSVAILDSAKNKSIINFYSPRLQITELDYFKLRFSKEIVFNKIQLDTPNISIFKPLKAKDTTKKDFNIEDINLYDKIHKSFTAIYGNQIILNDIKVNITDCSDTLIEKQKFEKISLIVDDLEIDYSTTIFSPNLFYADNITLTIKDLSFITKDSINEATLGKIVVSTKMKKINLFDFSFKPIIPIADVWSKFRYRKAVMFVQGHELSVSGIDFRELINKKIEATKITGDSIQLKVYVDKADTISPKIKPHLVELFLNAPIGIDINLMYITNVNVFYEEINEVTREKAYINLNNCDLKVFRIVNDSARIQENDIYSIIKAHGYINDSAEIDISIYYELRSKGNNSKIIGTIGECNANIFNTYTVNGANLEITEGRFQRIAFNFKAEDTIVTGKMKMEYQDLNANLLSQDTVTRRIKKFISWAAGVIIRNDNPRYGVYPKIGKIKYIHDRKKSDIGLWVKAILSGVTSTVAIDPSGDAKKIRKYKRIAKKNQILSLKDSIL